MKISIVTVTYNRKDMLGKAIQNVLAQNDPDFEHIIIDGGSDDGTKELLAQYSHLKVLSEPDKGVYDAMNKGIAMTTGDVVILLNSDDLLHENALQNIRNYFNKYPDHDYFCGGASVLHPKEGYEQIFDHAFYTRLSENCVTRGQMAFNAIICCKHVYDKIGKFSISHKIASDRDFVLRLIYRPDLKGGQGGNLLYQYLSHEDSLTFAENHIHKGVFYELLDIAGSGMTEYKTSNTALYKAYRRWHSWAVLRYFLAKDHQHNPSSILPEAVKATKRDVLWPARALLQVVDHFTLRANNKKFIRTQPL
ncbi:MAG: glycosyltransferase [Alphaproteobacteria bacterium]|nr:glycosyltransferase [Alphaproteobacteria bacterium]